MGDAGYDSYPVHKAAGSSHDREAYEPYGVRRQSMAHHAGPSAGGRSADQSNGSGAGPVMRKSCQHCRKRKIRCLPSEVDDAVCKACHNKGQPCVFERQSVMGRPPKSKKRDGEEEDEKLPASFTPRNGPSEMSLPARKRSRVEKDPSPVYSQEVPHSAPSPRHSVQYDALLPPIQAYYPPPPEYSFRTNSLEHRPEAYYTQHTYTGYPSLLNVYRPPSPQDLHQAFQSSPAGRVQHLPQMPAQARSVKSAQATAAVPAPLPMVQPPPPQPVRRPSRVRVPMVSAKDLESVQTQESLYEHFRQSSLQTVLSTFLQILAPALNPASASAMPSQASTDPSVPLTAKIRSLTARAIAYRKAFGGKPEPSSAEYARRLVSPLWDGLPVDIIALATTGRPSASGPFSLRSQAPDDANIHHAGEDYLFIKLLREDESSNFSLNEHHDSPRPSPYLQYAPTKEAAARYFNGYYSNHPLAPLLINDRLFLQDLETGPDDILMNVVIGSALARAPCLGGTTGDNRDIGEYFYDYIQDQLLSRPFEDCLSMATCQALLLWGTHELAHMRIRRTAALWSTAEVLLRQRIRRFSEKAAEDISRQSAAKAQGAPPPSPSLSWREMTEQELTVNALWIIVIFNCWGSLSCKLPQNTLGILATNVPAPPASAAASSSFAYTLSGLDSAVARQHVARRIIERFSGVTQLMTSIIAAKSQAQAKLLYAPDPARPLSTPDEPLVANFLLDMANYLGNPSSPAGNMLDIVPSSSMSSVSVSSRNGDSQNGFLVAAHAVLALHQLLPYAPSNGDEYGAPVPLPTLQSAETALKALHLLSKSITVNPAYGRTRTQALLLDALPRVLNLIDIFSAASCSSWSHLALITSNRDMIHELIAGLQDACTALEKSSPGGTSEANLKAALQRSSLPLATVADSYQLLQSSGSGRISPGLAPLIHGNGGPQVHNDGHSGSASGTSSWDLFDADAAQAAAQTLGTFGDIEYADSPGIVASLQNYLPEGNSYPFDFPSAQ